MDGYTTEVHVSGTEKFRRIALFGSLIFGVFSLLILLSGSRNCDTSDLRIPLYIVFSVHLTVFLLLLLHYIHLGACIRAVGKAIGLYYVYLVGAMIVVQIYYLKADGCARQSPLFYYWLAFNILLFYMFVAYGLSLWGAYICWEQEEEENVTKAAMEAYLKKTFDSRQNLLEAGYKPPGRLMEKPNPVDVEMQKALRDLR